MPEWVSSPLHRSLIEAMVAARKEAGLTQRDVAGRLHKPPSFVGKVEAIERNLSITEFLDWCSVLSVEPGNLLAHARGGAGVERG